MPLLRDFTLKSIIKFISLKALVVFCILGTIQSQTIKLNDFPVDVSIYDGQGSLMIEWSYPDSILENQIRIFVQESDQSNFELLTELTPDHNNYLDLRCEANSRYFYKIEVKDAFGTIFTSDFKTPAFGTCLTIEDSMAFDPTIRTVQDLVKKIEYSWFENYPLEHLKMADYSLQIIDEIIQNSAWIDLVLAQESIYRNHLLINPINWAKEIQNAASLVRGQWDLLYSDYYKAIEMLETTAPIRILGYNITEENQKELELYIFHPNQISSSEIFLLSGDEYVNLSGYQNENEPLFKVIIPDHWTTVDLMMDDIFIQTCPIIFNESIYFTLNGDFIPKNDHVNIRVGLIESSLWINELTWNPYTKNLHLEVAGNPEYEDHYSFRFEGESIWEVEMFSGYENQFQDSSIILQEEIEYPTFISFMKNQGGRFQNGELL